MLQQLEIQNIALIDSLSIEIGKGLNVLTGETGAGKSIIIDSINAILGERVSKDLIRTGKDKAVVQAVFINKQDKVCKFMDENGISIEDDGTLIISREVSQSGRNVCRVNGTMITVSVLKELGNMLIDVHGQHDNQSLLNVESHIDLLDAFGGKSIENMLLEYRALLKERRELFLKLESLSGAGVDRERKIDLLKYQIEEIKSASLKKGEEESLNKQRLFASGAEKIIATLSSTYETIYEGKSGKSGYLDGLNKSAMELSNISKYDKKFEDISQKMYEVTYLLEDICHTIRSERDNIDFDPLELEKIDERLDLIFKLKRKYGKNTDEVLSYLEKIELELEELLNNEELVLKISKQIHDLERKMLDICRRINTERMTCAKILEERIGSELIDLEMKRAEFKVNIIFDANEEANIYNFSYKGLDKVEFLFSANVGEPLKQLSKIASGGEMSRVMLAIKSILADVDSIPTLIFDEIDTGISGRAAQKVGEKLATISKHHQVLCVTHLTQIAAMADSNYFIEKITTDNSTYTNVKRLDTNEVRVEIARIIGGNATSDITLKHAGEILEAARSFKEAMA